MAELADFRFDKSKFKTELKNFELLLQASKSIGERDTVKQVFKNALNLSSFIPFVFDTSIIKIDKIADELPLFEDFKCDLVLGDSSSNKHFFVEFEGGEADNIFKKIGKKKTREFSPKYEHGISQVIDWIWKIKECQNSNQFRDKFGTNYIEMSCIVISGRKCFVDPDDSKKDQEKRRYEWRRKKIKIEDIVINCIHYDELLQMIKDRIDGVLGSVDKYLTEIQNPPP